MIFETDRTIIRRLIKSDVEDLVELYNDEEVFKHEFDDPRSFEDVEYTISYILEEYRIPERSVHKYVVEHKSDQKVIGTISYEFKDPDHLVCEIGGWIRTIYSKKGIGTEVVSGLLDTLFSQNTIRVFCSCSAENLGVIRLAEKLGFEKEGHIKMAIYVKGKYIDEVYFGLMKDDFQKDSS
ncbi:MAG: GNAT family protein [Saprospiraceae bacterium]|nr:GNAT family protein [Saprospiraceae bacterium]